ncbi:DUF4493 domain-containing protein [Parabacteroides sp. AF17-28]|uniref:DUF4493 domain-containing protein n=1 Tax=Parabacteroides sp. AF17-28 TaxID=2292241 RepID=UPI000EFDF10E|nr:DUF4493 domain-containing protein [Parabacteroides sp. AF17-28]RHR50777.1 DUF4493 domain-containing protein [Parabacteroides sp. AF17-28]
MKEYQLRQGLGKTIAFSLCVWASVAGFFSCDSDRLNGGGSTGMLSLNLAADTTNIKGGAISTKAGNILADFEDVDNYTVQVFQESDTLKSALYKDFPEQLEIKEGSYTLRASKGGNLPAAFDNPYFEGSTDFVIKKDMKTSLEVTCRMANARIYTEYTEDFLKAYSDYSVSLKTSYMDGAFTIAKGETRGAYLQVAKEGTPLSIAISLMRKNWEEPKVYSVTNPSITLNPKESVTLKFATDGKTGDGLALSIELDDSMEDADLEFGIPDFMWKPFTDLRIWACGFENNVPVDMNVTDGYQNDSCTVKAEVPGRIKECWVVRLEDGEKIDSVDIATSAGLNTAEKDWGVKSVSSPIAGVKGIELDLKGAFNQLYASEKDKTYGFSVYINDALNVMHTSDVVTASVNLEAAKEPTVGKFELAVPSKHSLEKDTAIAVMAEAGIKTLTLKVNKDGAMQGQYDMLSDNLPDGIFYDKQNRKIVFKKECSSKLESKEQDASTYSYEVSVTDNLDKKVTVTSTLEVTPVFTVVVPEGGVWTNRATIQVVEDVKYSKSYQLKVGEKWQDYSDATITGLQPNTTYTVRALVNNWPTTEATFTTEEAFQIPDGGFDKEWTKDVIDAVSTGIGDAIGLIGRDIDVWYPYNKDNKEGLFWSTSNLETTSANTQWGTAYYIQYSGVRNVNNAAELTTVAWGEGSTFTLLGGEIKNVTPGSLFAASYVDGELVEGHPISSRPAKLKFNYKYKPYKSDKFVVTVILENNTEGTIVEKTVQVPDAKDLFTSYELDFSSYITDEAKNKIKAERIKIYFRAGVNSTKKAVQGVRGSDGALKGYADSKRIGSVLTIDDIELIYE